MKTVTVVAIAMVDADGRVLLAQRPEGKSMAGMWEFPGGKLEIGETPEAAIRREIKEELNVELCAHCFAPLTFVSHAYADFHLIMLLTLAARAGLEPAQQPFGALARQRDPAVERLDRLDDARPHHVLELGAGEPDVGLQAGQRHGDGGVGVARQCLLRAAAVVAQTGHSGLHRRVVGVERGDRAVELLIDERDDGGDGIETRIGHRDAADIRLDGAKRIVRRLRGGRLGQRVEER